MLGDWKLRGLAEVGWAESWGGGDEAYFGRYTDYRDGVIDAARVEAHHAATGAYTEIGAQAIGRDDASAFLDAGQRGRLRVRAYYDELPHHYANDARILFDGVGSEHLTLPSGLVAGGNPDAAIDAEIANGGNSRLSLQRDKAGVEVQLDSESERRRCAPDIAPRSAAASALSAARFASRSRTRTSEASSRPSSR